MATSKIPAAAVLIIGNEILSGRTQDANLNYIAKKLTSIGIKLAEVRIVPDIEEEIVAAVNVLRKRYTYLFTTGGIGPTHDDITAESIAKAFGQTIIENPEARDRLMIHYTDANINPARMRMARMPKNAMLIDNPVSAAPGFQVGNVYVMAGVPNIMQSMMDIVASTLPHGPAIHSISISGYVAESIVAAELTAIAARYHETEIGSYPWTRRGRWGTALVVRGTDAFAVKAAADEVYSLVAKHDAAPEVEASPSEA
jgi:molybdenum cofactor synthesis domain-containing protein